MSPVALLSLAVLGVVVGFVSGLVGIGGGVLIVPFLYFFYGHPEFAGVVLASGLHAAVAHATSLFIIVPTAVMGTVTYHRLGAVVWRVALPVGLFSVLGAVGGSRLAPLLRPEWLKLGFGVFLCVTAFNLAFGKRQEAGGEVRVSVASAAVTGLLVGLLSALLGVGGGIIAIPLLLRLMHVRMGQVAATSLAIVGVAATAGAVSYMVTPSPAGLPGGHVGYVHVAAAVPILVAAAITVRWGAKVNQRLDARKLRLGFALLFAVLGLRLIVQNAALAWS
jgi:uncharacterized membrane protein YfcA